MAAVLRIGAADMAALQELAVGTADTPCSVAAQCSASLEEPADTADFVRLDP